MQRLEEQSGDTVSVDTSSQKGIAMNNNPSSESRIVMLCVLGVGLLVIVNIIIAAILLGRPSTPSVNVMPSSGDQKSAQQPIVINTGGGPGQNGAGAGAGGASGKTYLIANGHDYGGYEYIDAGGVHRGFFRDLTKKVCEAAGINCEVVFDKYSNCWESDPGVHTSMGEGLQARWYDACIGWSPTIERIHIASFSTSFLNKEVNAFFSKKGNTFSTATFTNKKIGFIEGWAASEKCLARLYENKGGIPLKGDTIKYYVDPTGLYEAINNGEVVAGFASTNEMQYYIDNDMLTKGGEDQSCTMGGDAVATRKDSNFNDLWNKGFNILWKNGQFNQVCHDAKLQHKQKGEIDCVSGSWNV